MRIRVTNRDGVTKRRNVKVGSPFQDTMQQRAAFDMVFWYKVFINDKEVMPENCPEKIEAGMDIHIIHEDAVK